MVFLLAVFFRAVVLRLAVFFFAVLRTALRAVFLARFTVRFTAFLARFTVFFAALRAVFFFAAIVFKQIGVVMCSTYLKYIVNKTFVVSCNVKVCTSVHNHHSNFLKNVSI